MGNGGFFTPEELAERRRIYEQQRMAEERSRTEEVPDLEGAGNVSEGFVDGDPVPVVTDGNTVPDGADVVDEVEGTVEASGDVVDPVRERRVPKRERKGSGGRRRKVEASALDVDDDGGDTEERRVRLRVDSAHFAALQLLAIMEGRTLGEYLSDMCVDLVEKNRKKLNQPMWDILFKR